MKICSACSPVVPSTWIAAAALFGPGACFSAEPGQASPRPLRVEVTRDLWISSFSSEREGNNGASPKLKLKGIQEFFLIDFDPTPLRGCRVVRAQLHLHLESQETLGRISVSTVAEPWVEGSGTGYARVPGASSFLWARTGEQAWRQGDVTGSVLGAGGTIWGFGDPTPPSPERWQIIPVEPRVVQARIDGSSEGFCVMDDVGSEYTRTGNTFDYRPFLNRYVSSKDGKRANVPYFTLWLEEGSRGAGPQREATAPAGAVVASRPALPPAPGPALRPAARPEGCLDLFGAPLASLDFRGARGETIGFSVAPPSSGEVRLAIPGLRVERFSMPLVAGRPDPLLPEGANGAAPAAGGGVFLEVHIPKDASPGRHEGALWMGGQEWLCAVTVWDFELPDRLSFLPQMNAYGLPDGQELAYYRLAHEHRTVLNCLPYGWTGRVDDAPRVSPQGEWDWSAWDAKFGPLVDGSAFADLPRGPVPIEALYLPLNENWPMDHEKHFRGGYWIESAYSEDYWEAFRDAAARFAEHFAGKGWNETMFEFYLNNKVYFKKERGNRWDASSAAWIFDEPMNTQDFWALRRFGLEFWQGVAAHPGARFAFRVDISRPEWQRDLLDGLSSVEVVSGVLRTYRARARERAERCRNLVYMYGSANRIGTSNAMPAAWCVEAWALGADGVVPWQTIGKARSWEQPDELSLFYPTPQGPVPSLRLKCFRAGQQMAEYLTLYASLSGTDREVLGAEVLQLPGLRAALLKKSEADAGGSLFGAEAGDSLQSLRLRLGEWLHQRRPAARLRWHDPRPPLRDPAAVRAIVPLAAPGDPHLTPAQPAR